MAALPGSTTSRSATPDQARRDQELTRYSLARNHGLVDGNKRLALAAMIAFYGVTGRRLTLTNDEAYDLVIAVASGTLDAVEQVAGRLAAATEDW